MQGYRDLVAAFTKIGLLSFGGPVAQIGVMHRELVEQRGWLTDDQFSRGLSFSMLLPGPEAMQLCTYAGWRLRGILGGLLAGALFVLPGAVFMAAITLAYLRWGNLPAIAPAFLGIKATVVVVVAQALARLVRKNLTSTPARLVALAAFALLLAGLPFPFVVLGAATFGYVRATGTAPLEIPVGQATMTALFWALLWLAPIAALYATQTQPMADLIGFFTRLAAFSFGGAYAALAWMSQALVETHGWLTPAQMLDGLGLAETTPGPLILVTQFAGMVAMAEHGTGAVLAAGALTLWAIFVPCFGLVFTFAPALDSLTTHPRLSAALSSVSAAVTGVIGALALYFMGHTLFPGGLSLAGAAPEAFALTTLAALLLIALRWPLPVTLLFLAGAGGLLGWLP
ncbi:chromate efflux transporter [Maritimibacter sp. DP1N21-5]|nr:chromate efflux transporter [Maritimibacter sp. DP1N21-5]MBV7409670.1 chromate efflux transporter [Maritimibacter sp. DP1N21-5]